MERRRIVNKWGVTGDGWGDEEEDDNGSKWPLHVKKRIFPLGTSCIGIGEEEEKKRGSMRN